jgi:hypothetical protein
MARRLTTLGEPTPSPGRPPDLSDTTIVERADGGLSGARRAVCRLVVVAAPKATDVGRAFDLSAGPCLVGRLDGAQLCIADAGVSRQHVRFSRRSGTACILVDLGSTNGTFVNGERVATSLIHPGDWIQIGPNTVLELTAVHAASEHCPSPASASPAKAEGTQPAVRASYARGILSRVDQIPGAPACVRSRLGQEVLSSLTDAEDDAWLPVEADVELARASRDLLTREHFVALHRESLRAELSDTSLRRLVDGARLVFGDDLGRWACIVPRVWAALFRGCGRWSVGAVDPSRVPLTISQLPLACLADRAWPEARAAALSALLDEAGAPGAVELTGLEPARREAQMEWRWGRC